MSRHNDSQKNCKNPATWWLFLIGLGFCLGIVEPKVPRQSLLQLAGRLVGPEIAVISSHRSISGTFINQSYSIDTKPEYQQPYYRHNP